MNQLRVALVGQAGSGKDYFCGYLSLDTSVYRAAYADALKVDVGQVLSRSNRNCLGWINERKHIPQVRALLQAYGEAMVTLRGEEFWAERAALEYRLRFPEYALPTDSPSYRPPPDAIVITDCRKVPEAEHARRDGFVIVRVVRTDGVTGAGITVENAQHRSETEQAQIVTDYTIENDGTPAFHDAIDVLIAQLRA